MFRALVTFSALVLTLTLGCGLAMGFTFSVDGGPAGSVPVPYSDGTLIGYSCPPTYRTDVLSGYPVDALHIGTPVRNVITRLGDGSYRIVSPLFFSIDNGDPFPIGVAPTSAEEIFVANKWATGAPDGTFGTATCGELTGSGSTLPAIESTLGLGADGIAYDDDVDALDLRNVDPAKDLIFFSIDDFTPFVPNAPTAMQTRDIFVRLPGTGSVVKVLDGFTDIGRYDGIHGPSILCDDIDALIIVEVDDNPSNNKFVTVVDPETQQSVRIDLGDGILFSVDRDLPDPDGGGALPAYLPSLDPGDIYFSPLTGVAPILVVDGQEAYLTSSGPLGLTQEADLDALAAWGAEGQVPEPGTLLLVGTGLMGAAGWLRRRKLTD